jgi:hypothetical protein
LATKERRERKGSEIPSAGCGQQAGGGGKRWVGKRVDLGKGGQVAGKWTGFSHIAPASTRLGPDNSTQVVDFPHKATVRLFGEQGFYRRDAETQSHAKQNHRGTETQSQAGAWNWDGKWSAGVLEYWERRGQEAGRTVQLNALKCG